MLMLIGYSSPAIRSLVSKSTFITNQFSMVTPSETKSFGLSFLPHQFKFAIISVLLSLFMMKSTSLLIKEEYSTVTEDFA